MPRTRPFPGAVILALAALLPSATLPAQQALAPGARVRVKSDQLVAPVIGTYQEMRRDTLVVIEEGTSAQLWTFTRNSIDRIEVSAGMHNGNRGPTTRFALIGAGIGAAAGWLVAALLESNSSSDYNDLLSAAVGAAVGGGAGAAYGYRKLEERWTPVPIPGRIGLSPTRRGVRLGLSRSF
jgi:hypothetical protein